MSRMSDRLFALAVIVVALGYILSATTIQSGFMPDPVGPKLFPYMIGGAAIIAAITILIRPDEEPDWPGAATFGRIALAVIVLVGYAYALKPLGFLIPTAIAAGLLSYQIHPNARRAALTGLGLSIGLFVIFRFGLGLGLFGFPRGWGIF